MVNAGMAVAFGLKHNIYLGRLAEEMDGRLVILVQNQETQISTFNTSRKGSIHPWYCAGMVYQSSRDLKYTSIRDEELAQDAEMLMLKYDLPVAFASL